MCCGIGRFRLKYLLAFGTGVLFGFALDGWFLLLGGNGVCASMPLRVLLFTLGETVTALAVAFYFRTGLPLQIYELVVTEISRRYGIREDKTKRINDVVMLVLSVGLALLLHRSLQGIGVGTVIITAVNAVLIGRFGKLLDRLFTFEPRFPRLVKLLGLGEKT